jgi:hypothetical protein
MGKLMISNGEGFAGSGVEYLQALLLTHLKRPFLP